MTTRTRFAPSPTGYLHVGSARTALYSYLIARQKKGQFILRIEDTDLERSTAESVQAILDGMAWLNLDYDEGPFYQTERFDRYLTVAEDLVKSGHAYYCDCSKERLEALRARQTAAHEKPRYDGHCRNRQNINPATPHVIRFKNDKEGTVNWDDLVKGPISFSNTELDDLIIVRTDGAPTYNFTVVVDDHDMNITEVIRGDDHVNNTPRQINILKALGKPLPLYAHVPMILGADGKRLSKRHGAVSITQYADEGYLPEALLNYLFRLGFSHGDQEIFSRDEMVALFRLNKVSNSPAAFNVDKLKWLNQHYIKTLPLHAFQGQLLDQFKAIGLSPDAGPSLEALVPIMADRTHTLQELVAKSIYFYSDHYPLDQAAIDKHLGPESKAPLTVLAQTFETLEPFTAENIHTALQTVAESLQLSMGKIGMPLRVALTGGTQSPPIDKTAELLGKARTLARIKRYV